MYIDYNFLLKELPEEYRSLNDIIDYEYFIDIASLKIDSLLNGEYYDYSLGKKVEFDRDDPPLIIKSLVQVLTAKYISDFLLRGSRVSTGGAVKLYGLEIRYNGDYNNMQAYRDLYTERFKDLMQIALNSRDFKLYSEDFDLTNEELGDYLNSDVRYQRGIYSEWFE